MCPVRRALRLLGAAASRGQPIGVKLDNPTAAEAPASAPGQTQASVRYSYQAAGHSYLPSSRTDADGGCRAPAYDSAGNLTDTYTGLTPVGGDCDGHTSSERWQWLHSYKPDGTVATMTDPNGKVTNYSYDTAGNLVGIDHSPPGEEASGAVHRARTGAATTKTLAIQGFCPVRPWDSNPEPAD